MYVYTHTYSVYGVCCTGVYTCTQACMCRPEVEIGYLPQLLSTFFRGTNLSLIPEFTYWSLSGQQTPGVQLTPSHTLPPSTGVAGTWRSARLWRGHWASKLKSSCLCHKHLTDWVVHLLSCSKELVYVCTHVYIHVCTDVCDHICACRGHRMMPHVFLYLVYFIYWDRASLNG